jgi:hypothetical protein
VSTPMRPEWDDDQRLLDDLGEAIRAVDPIARIVAEHGRGALTWSSVDDDLLLACVSFDSLREPLGTVRAESPPGRMLVFTADPLSVELEIEPGGGIVGQVVPPAAAQIRVETTDGAVHETTADDLGFFTLPAIGDGPVRLRCDTATSRLVTRWVEL